MEVIRKDNMVNEFIRSTIEQNSKRDLDSQLRLVLQSALNISHADSGALYLLDQSKENLIPQATMSRYDENNRFQFVDIPLYVNGERNNDKPTNYCLYTQEILHIKDIYSYTGFDVSEYIRYDEFYRHPTKSISVYPLKSLDYGILGVIIVINYRDILTNKNVTLPKDKLNALELFSAQATMASENYLLEKKNCKLITLLQRNNNKLENENTALRRTMQLRFDYSNIIGDSPAMRKVYSLMDKVSNSSATVLLRGKTGTGKELIANTLHINSNRRNKPFVVQNCAALPDNLLESELFGYKKGAFSGAVYDKKGLIEQADGGTLFLDEIGDMPLALQAKILRVLQDKVVRPLGSSSATGKEIDVRVIAATHCNLQHKIKEGSFREDLFYRLSVFPIELPTLQQRVEDIPELVEYFVRKMSRKHQKEISGVSSQAQKLLYQYSYPGNVRDLMNIVERSVLMTESGHSIHKDQLPEELINNVMTLSIKENDTNKLWSNVIQGHLSGNPTQTLKEIVGSFEAGIIKMKLEQCQWNQTKAANELSIARRTIIDKMTRYGIGKSFASSISVEQSV